MVLNDWQRGKLPFYVAPDGFEVPLSKQTEKQVDLETNDEQQNNIQEIEGSENTTDNAKEKEDNLEKPKLIINKLIVAQDFAKIRVGLPFDNEDDVKPLQKITIPEELKGIDDNDDEEKSQAEEKDDLKENESDSDSDISNFYSNGDEACSDIEDYLTNDPETVKDLKRRKLEVASGVFTVEELSQRSTERKAGEIQKITNKMTAKQRRAVERSRKRTKTGSNFYEVSNVKNRNRNKKNLL
ncbi:unnamed protein product, partial [Iphiclides podalirius]